MKTKKIIIFSTIILVVGYLLCSQILLVEALYSICKSYICKPDIEYVKNNNWVFEKGFDVSRDFIVFKEPQSNYIKGDTIFYKKEYIAKIIRTNKYLGVLEVKSFSNDSTGIYYRRRW